MANYILIEVDMNDGDYASKFAPISDEELKEITPLIEKIKANPKRHNFPYGEHGDKEPDAYDMYVSQDDDVVDYEEEIFETFEDYLPVTEYGFHTITRIELFDVGHAEKLL